MGATESVGEQLYLGALGWLSASRSVHTGLFAASGIRSETTWDQSCLVQGSDLDGWGFSTPNHPTAQ